MSNFNSPSKKDFLGNLESAPIWKKCVEILEKAKELNTFDSEKTLIRAQLTEEMDHLKELGIFPGINTNLEIAEYENPVTAAKWIAGQILSLITNGIVSADEAFENRGLESNILVIETPESSSVMSEFSIDQQQISTLELFLNIDRTESIAA